MTLVVTVAMTLVVVDGVVVTVVVCVPSMQVQI
jgi:hypothetical protein